MMAKRSKKASPTKKRKSSVTTRSTGGGGFVFEDQIAAFLLVKMLSGEPIPGLGDEGLGNLLQMQTSSLGWTIDDLLAVSESAGSKLALSCKSNMQVTGTGLPDSFVIAAWQQWKAPRPPSPFDQSKDKLMLVTRGKHQAFEPLWADIKTWCSHPDNPLALARAKQTAAHGRIFKNTKSAIQTVDKSVSDEDVIALLSRLEVLATDFDLPNSQNRADSIVQCRKLLVSGSQPEAVELWNALVSEAEAARVSHGLIKLNLLWPKLTKRFRLKPHLNYDRSWNVLDAITADNKAGVQTALPTGFSLDRKFESDVLVERFSADPVLVVFGDSGSGKSALVKQTLDQRYPSWKQIWLTMDDLGGALSAARRQSIGLDHALDEVFRFSPYADNVLVLDAAERFSDELVAKAQSLVSALIEHNKSASLSWRIVIIGQIDGWSQGKLQRIGNSTLPQHYEVKPLSLDEVREGLQSAPQLRWAAARDEIVLALTNPRTLAWVVQAAAQFEGGNISSLASHIAIADHLWRYWTADKLTLQRTLMVLAEREANFEHSFELSKLDPGDVQAIENKPPQLPLRRNKYNRFEFEHDLAADWIRFQRLKEIASETGSWAQLASNPLWLGALRMLGGFLLREQTSDGQTAWDVAFEAVTSKAENATAADVLLDALCLDPNAEVFLTERVDLLLRDHGKLLMRLLRRFLHVATVPGGPSKLLGDVLYADPSFSLYLEAQFRTPIPGRWVALARFLRTHQGKIAALYSSTVAKVCERWLSGFPAMHAGTPFLLRTQFAELALATARAVQLEQRKGTIFADDSVKDICTAALAGAPDLPDQVSQWALEMARRRPLDATLAAAVAEHRRKQAIEHEEKLRTDEEYRKRHERRQSAHVPYTRSGRKLPPWSLGPQGRVDHHFRDACANGAALIPLMRVRSSIAAELLLAIVIEGEPEEEYGTSRFRDNVGLQYDHQSYPTGFWKSPFFSFLQIDRDAALDALTKLINFCTDRWIHEVKRHSEGRYPSIKLILNDGTEKEFFGNSRVYDWCLSSSSFAGQLSSGLAALERWLSLLVSAGEDVDLLLERILTSTNSVAVLAVLANIGKLKPELFLGVLKPLAASEHLYRWDENLVKSLPMYFDGMQLARLGELIFGIARDWHFAPQHKVSMTDTVIDLIGANQSFAEFVRSACTAWKTSTDEKAALEQRILSARLDSNNYSVTVDTSTNAEKREFKYPERLLVDIDAFQQSKAAGQTIVLLPDYCLRVLGQPHSLQGEDADRLAGCFTVIDNETELEDHFKERARIAVASTLIAKAPEWLQQHEETKRVVDGIIAAEVMAIGHTAEALRSARHDWRDDLSFLTYALFHQWLKNPSSETDAAVMRLMTSGNRGAETLLFGLAHQHRQELGGRWARLVDLGLLWAGLSILRPGFDEEAVAWNNWLRRFRAWRLNGYSSSPKRIEAVDIANRVEKLERARWNREFDKQDWHSRMPPEERRSEGLDWSFLETAFAWLTPSDGQKAPLGASADSAEERRLLLSLWSYEVWLRHRSVDERNDDPGPTQIGYSLLDQLAKRAMQEPSQSAMQMWEPVLVLGAPAHYAVGQFLQSWFAQAQKADPVEFGTRWRPMIEYALGSPTWGDGNPWYYGQRILTQVFGCYATDSLDANPAFQTIVLGFKPLYQVWASRHLRKDDDNVKAICSFLSSSTGKLLRLDGLSWIHAVLVGNDPVYIGWRSTALDSLVNLLDVILAEDISILSGTPAARSTFLAIIDALVAKQVPAALALQERARRLLRPDRS
ncbi:MULTISPECIES: hypothetical protein [Bradyrhizobium]|uniref:hypothetical protein n=1 Tax=Bradyrhizobium TaxID=374 RepID=UPI00155E2306|nr:MULTISPECIES: hypothetical protein [Bradyrhizobium]MDD1523465.1 hypothetical protein [Bradyrhizobium sp. WBAH30]MDD1547551.1 hypothetical protein [Bradyrhizobium sp. WBAH41]MDD1561190.1 hypothetical protein [Bradyrhizobium sp. WBAH23]MDD1568666.1 hypothetical protein [Bradyrhizobium sp. WBAH33]MDD1594644.1 hypothetical protein [Bradyrhizobium sp. WBAH42]